MSVPVLQMHEQCLAPQPPLLHDPSQPFIKCNAVVSGFCWQMSHEHIGLNICDAYMGFQQAFKAVTADLSSAKPASYTDTLLSRDKGCTKIGCPQARQIASDTGHSNSQVHWHRSLGVIQIYKTNLQSWLPVLLWHQL